MPKPADTNINEIFWGNSSLPKLDKIHSVKYNLLSFDIEDWFHTSALHKFIDPGSWDRLESRITPNVLYILELLEKYHTRATFFVLGWVAKRYPNLVRQIHAAGHEIASHGWRHRLIYHLDQATFQDYLRRSKELLEDLTGKQVLGYRATSFSVVKNTLWALDKIRAAGFIYDSSIFPVRHDIYGIDGFPRFPFLLDNGLIEIPPSTLNLWGKHIPIAGGGYFRLYPYVVTKKGIQALNRAGYPAMVYLHPWELDPHCPRLNHADWRTRFRQYVNLDKTKLRLSRLLADFTFIPVREYVTQYRNSLKPAPVLTHIT
jgi:polysaccharide deacetylase family protein (PEP-CTERM system associated)